MATNNKVLLFFSDGKFGWSEVYYDPAVNATLADTRTKSLVLANARQMLLAQGAGVCVPGACGNPTLRWIRISTVGVKRNTLFYNPSGVLLGSGTNAVSGTIGKGVSANAVSSEAPDNPYSAVEMVCTLAHGGQSKRALSGVPDGFICDQALNYSDPFVKQFKAFTDILADGSTWGALSTLGPEDNRTLGGGNTSLAGATAVTSWTQDSKGRPVATLAAPMTPPPGLNCCGPVRIVIFCYQPDSGFPNINGTYPVTFTTVAGQIVSFTLRKPFKPLSTFCPGFAVFYQPQVLPFTSAVMGGPVERKRGLPFDRPRGRARRRN